MNYSKICSYLFVVSVSALLLSCKKQAIVSEETLELTTYPYGDPDATPRPQSAFYPYFKYDDMRIRDNRNRGKPLYWKTTMSV
ncbi:MAG: hypothetical protein LBF85_00555 [Tannerella sp.]|jgi:hypothetical protein|nr:hypothetical protein [Tannerella sp.]